MNLLEEAPVLIEEEVTELRCDERNHRHKPWSILACTVQAKGLLTSCTDESTYVCGEILAAIMLVMSLDQHQCAMCFRSVNECWAVTPL